MAEWRRLLEKIRICEFLSIAWILTNSMSGRAKWHILTSKVFSQKELRLW
jgi:hypothetical protein